MNKKEEMLKLINYQIASIDGAIDGLGDMLPATDVIAKSDLINMTKRDRERLGQLKTKATEIFSDIEIIKSEYSLLGIRSKAIEDALDRLISPVKNSH